MASSSRRGRIVAECEECGEVMRQGDCVLTCNKCGNVMCEEHINDCIIFTDPDLKLTTLATVLSAAGWDLEDAFLCPHCFFSGILDVLETIKDQELLKKILEEMMSLPDFFDDGFLDTLLHPEEGESVFKFSEEIISDISKRHHRFQFSK